MSLEIKCCVYLYVVKLSVKPLFIEPQVDYKLPLMNVSNPVVINKEVAFGSDPGANFMCSEDYLNSSKTLLLTVLR